MPERAVIYVPADRNQTRWLTACQRYCDRLGYEAVGAVLDGNRSWADAEAMLTAGTADVIVVARYDHIPTRPGFPVVEYVTRQPRPADEPPPDLPRTEIAGGG